MSQELLFDGLAPDAQIHQARSVRVSLTERGLVVAFAIEGGPMQCVRWIARDAVQVRDVARQLVTLAEGMGAEPVCLCELFRPPCPVHSGEQWWPAQPDGPRESTGDQK